MHCNLTVDTRHVKTSMDLYELGDAGEELSGDGDCAEEGALSVEVDRVSTRVVPVEIHDGLL